MRYLLLKPKQIPESVFLLKDFFLQKYFFSLESLAGHSPTQKRKFWAVKNFYAEKNIPTEKNLSRENITNLGFCFGFNNNLSQQLDGPLHNRSTSYCKWKYGYLLPIRNSHPKLNFEISDYEDSGLYFTRIKQFKWLFYSNLTSLQLLYTPERSAISLANYVISCYDWESSIENWGHTPCVWFYGKQKSSAKTNQIYLGCRSAFPGY